MGSSDRSPRGLRKVAVSATGREGGSSPGLPAESGNGRFSNGLEEGRAALGAAIGRAMHRLAIEVLKLEEGQQPDTATSACFDIISVAASHLLSLLADVHHAEVQDKLRAAPTTSSATSLNGRALSSRFPPPPFSVPMLGPDCSILGSPLETWIERERAVGVAPMRATSPPRQTAIPDADHTMASWLEARELEQQQDCATSAASLAIDMVDLDVEVGDDDDPFDVA